MFVDPKTGQLVPVDRAAEMGTGENGANNPDYIFLVDAETGNVTSLGALIENGGQFDPSSGTFLSANTGKRMSLEDAIAEGLIIPRLEGEK